MRFVMRYRPLPGSGLPPFSVASRTGPDTDAADGALNEGQFRVLLRHFGHTPFEMEGFVPGLVMVIRIYVFYGLGRANSYTGIAINAKIFTI